MCAIFCQRCQYHCQTFVLDQLKAVELFLLLTYREALVTSFMLMQHSNKSLGSLKTCTPVYAEDYTSLATNCATPFSAESQGQESLCEMKGIAHDEI